MIVNKYWYDKNMKLSICNEELDQLFFSEPRKILFYGEAASGKTNLLLNIIKCSISSLEPYEALFYISTEGSISIERILRLRLLSHNLFFSIAIDQYHILMLILDIIKRIDAFRPVCLFIDSINSHYRIESISHEGIILFLKLLTLLDILSRNNIYIIASAQIKFGEQMVPGYEYLSYWTDIEVEVLRERSVYRILRFHKPFLDKIFYFTIVLNGIRWIKTH